MRDGVRGRWGSGEGQTEDRSCFDPARDIFLRFFSLLRLTREIVNKVFCLLLLVSTTRRNK